MWLFLLIPVGIYAFSKTDQGKSFFSNIKFLKKLQIHSPLVNTPTLAAQVASTGPAKPAAQALYAFLKKNGNAQSPALSVLVQTFQKSSNLDASSNHLIGTLPETGVYDAATSAGLTMYTHDPVPMSPGAPPPPPPSPAVVANPLIPGAASSSGFNLYTYLKASKARSGDTYTQLVKQFQTDVNTDPKFPGPASADGLPKVVHTALTITGSYDAPTAAALTVVSADPIGV
jgi:hypothetical protein